MSPSLFIYGAVQQPTLLPHFHFVLIFIYIMFIVISNGVICCTVANWDSLHNDGIFSKDLK